MKIALSVLKFLLRHLELIKELLKQAAFGGQMVSKEAQQQVLRAVKKMRGIGNRE